MQRIPRYFPHPRNSKIYDKEIKLTAKTVGEDPAGYQRWIALGKRSNISQNIKNQKTRSPKTTAKLIVTTCIGFS